MSLSQPEFLIALVLLPFLFVLNRWRFRRRKVAVSSLLLWKQVQAQPSSPQRQWKRKMTLLFLFQALCFLALVLSLCEPQVPRDRAEIVQVILDRSASMNSNKEGGRTRLDAGKDKLLQLMEGLPRDTQFQLTLLPPPRRVPAGKLETRASLASKLKDLRGSNAPLNLHRALQPLLASRKGKEMSPCILLSDKFLDPKPLRLEGLRLALFGSPSRNVGIVDAGFGKEGVVVAVKNFSNQAVEVPLHVLADEKKIPLPAELTSLRLGAGEKRKFFFEMNLEENQTSQVIQVLLGIDDELAADNQCTARYLPRPALKVYHEGPTNPYFLKALEAVGGIELIRGSTGQSPVREAFFMSVFSRNLPPLLPRGHVVAIYPLTDSSTLQREKEERKQGVIPVSSPLLDGGEFQLRIGSLLRFKGGWDEIYLKGGANEESVLVGRRGEMTVFAFRPEESDIHLHPVLPVIFARIVERIRGGSGRALTAFRTGEPLTLPWIRGKRIEVINPFGEIARMPSVPGKPFSFVPLYAGTYKIRGENSSLEVPVNLMNEEESDNGGVSMALGKIEPLFGKRREDHSLLPYCLLLCFIFAGLLWWFERKF